MKTLNQHGADSWTISKKLAITFACTTLITIMLGGLGYFSAVKNQSTVEEIGLVRLPSVESLQKINVAMAQINGIEEALQNVALTIDDRLAMATELDTEWNKLNAAWDIYAPLPQTEQEAIEWREFKSSFTTWKNDHTTFMALADRYTDQLENGNSSSETLQLMREQFLQNNKLTSTESYMRMQDVIAINANIGDTLTNVAIKRGNFIEWISLIGLLFGTLLAGVLGYWVTRSINKVLNPIIEQLTNGAEMVNSSATQLSGSSQQLAESANQQAASLQETNSSLEEMASQTQQTDENCNQAESAMRQTNGEVKQGVEAIERMNRAMQEIQNASEETSKIIKTIDDIAFQTNLLALNAAVEAARAGEAGKGFAVVAEEVRNLAQRSAEAAQNTSELIEKSQSSSSAGSAIAKDVAENLQKIASSSSRMDTLVTEISTASKEQAIGIKQMNSVMNEMDNAVQDNASASEESASAAEELSAQAAELMQVVADMTRLVGARARYEAPKNYERMYAGSQKHIVPARKQAPKATSPAFIPLTKEEEENELTYNFDEF